MSATIEDTGAARLGERPAALADLRVVEFGGFAAGPAIGKHMADHGAEVIRVESRRRPDPLRSSPPFREARPGPNRSGYYASYNAGKRALGARRRDRELAAQDFRY